MSNHFGTGTQMFVTQCSQCGSEIHFEHTGPLHDRANVIARVKCGACHRSGYALIQADKAYKMRPDTIDLQIGILRIFEKFGPPLTVREVYYQCTVAGLVEKTDAGLRKVQTQLTAMRRGGTVPYGWVADNGRYVVRAQTYRTLEDAMSHWQKAYRRDLWQSQNVHVELWVEKKALIGVLEPITSRYGVALFPASGYSSIAFAYDAAEQLKTIDKPVFIYHVGDFDADGLHAAETIEAELRLHGAQFKFERLGVTWQQVQEYNLPTRPQKTKSPRYKWFKQKYGNLPACELEALPPDVLRHLVESAITRHIDRYEWVMSETIEKQERETLDHVLSAWRGDAA